MAEDIYTYIEDNFNIKITDYVFKRDYIKDPLKRSIINKLCTKVEYPDKDDVRYLFLKLNLSRNDVTKILGVSKTTLSRIVKLYSLQKSQKLYEKVSRKVITKLLQDNPNLYVDNTIRSKQTKLERYGDEKYNNIERIKETVLNKYGVDNYSKTRDFKNTIKDIFSKKTKDDLEAIKRKRNKTMIERYNDKNYNNRDKMKQTNIKLFGVDSYSKTETYKLYMSNPSVKNLKLKKEIETKRKNGTLGKSISSKETEWLNSLGLPNDKKHRQVMVNVNDKSYIVDGFDKTTNTVYEFFGDYWHGNPKTTIQENINHQKNKTFGDLYSNTLERIEHLKTKYNVVYIWESEWN